MMRKPFLLLFFLFMQTVLFAQKYYPEGTKWTEIRLDTLKFESWYSQVGHEWVPNFETVEYHVKGEYIDKNGYKYRCVYTNGPEWTDSLTLLLQEEGDAEYVAQNCVMVSVPFYDFDGSFRPLWPSMAYQFDWSVGQGLYFEDILLSNTTSIERFCWFYGIIAEIKKGNFGGVQPLSYVDLVGKAPQNEPGSSNHNIDTNGGRIIQGLGITEWCGGECLFGPPNPYSALSENPSTKRHCRSMLVHFERNGELLYDVWPETGASSEVSSLSKAKSLGDNMLYTLQGLRHNSPSQRGVYIRDGRKVVMK